jgi:hypothetical protein
VEQSDDHYRTLDEKPYESIYLYVDAIIDHPIERVWPHALNIGSWMNKNRLVTLAGESGKVGHFQRVHPQGLADDVPQPRYHLYGVAEIIPMKLIALEVIPEKGGSYGKTRPKMCVDSITLSDLGGRTKIAYLLVEVNLGNTGKEFCVRRKAEIESFRSVMEEFFQNLGRLAAEN